MQIKQNSKHKVTKSNKQNPKSKQITSYKSTQQSKQTQNPQQTKPPEENIKRNKTQATYPKEHPIIQIKTNLQTPNSTIKTNQIPNQAKQ